MHPAPIGGQTIDTGFSGKRQVESSPGAMAYVRIERSERIRKDLGRGTKNPLQFLRALDKFRSQLLRRERRQI
jgi:hypothetical protein